MDNKFKCDFFRLEGKDKDDLVEENELDVNIRKMSMGKEMRKSEVKLC